MILQMIAEQSDQEISLNNYYSDTSFLQTPHYISTQTQGSLMAQTQYQTSQNQPIQIQTAQLKEEQIKNELDFTEYKKNFLPIFLQGYELYLKKKRYQQGNSRQSLYGKVDNLFKQLQVEGNDRKKYGIKLIKLLQKNKDLNFSQTVNDYRRTFAPLYFMKKIPKDEGRKDKLKQYIETLKEPFPSEKLQAHLQKEKCKQVKTDVIQIDKAIQKPKNDKNIYRKLLRDIRKSINKQYENIYKLNQKGLYDFFDCYKSKLIEDKDKLVNIIQQSLKDESNKNQRKKIQKFLNHVNNQTSQQD